jgi:hypothetical protein
VALEKTSADRVEQSALTLLVIAGDERDAFLEPIDDYRRLELPEVAHGDAAEEHRSTAALMV